MGMICYLALVIVVIGIMISVLKNTIKLLFNKRVYQIDKEHKVRDFIELSAIFILILMIISIPVILYNFVETKNSCSYPYESSYSAKKSLSYLNQILTLEYALNKKEPKNVEEFSKVFQQRTNLQGVYNTVNISDGKFHTFAEIKDKKITKKIDKKLSIYPCFYAYDGILYFLRSYKNGCKIYNLDEPEKSDCWLTVDLNGIYPPNKEMEFEKNYQNNIKSNGDQITVVIRPSDADKNMLTVSLPNKYKELL